MRSRWIAALAALGGLCVARFLLREAVEKRLPRALERRDRSFDDGGSFYLPAVRMRHVARRHDPSVDRLRPAYP